MDAEGRAAGVVSQTAIGEAIRGAHAAGREEQPSPAETAQKVIR